MLYRSWRDSSKGPQQRALASIGCMETGMMGLGDLLPTGGLSSKVPAAGAYVGDGMPPVPAKLAAKIRRWEFMEMGELLPKFLVGPHKEAEGESARGRPRQARKVTDIFTSVGVDGLHGGHCAGVSRL